MALIGEMHYLTIGGSTYSIPISGGSTVTVTRSLTSGTKSATISVDGTDYDLYAPTPNAGTVTSVRVQATSPVQSSTSTAQSSTLNTTISLANNYGDTKNPYASKTKNYVLAAPATENGVPSFRALVAADIPDLSDTYATQTDLENLPEPMIFKGSLGTNGTITSLPTAAASNEGYTYKVITAGTYASQSAKVGDTFISDGSSWVLIPSGDEPSGTVTSITLTQGTGITVSNSGTAITTSGSRTISLASITKNNTTSTASPSHGGTFTAIDSVTYDDYGRVTGVNTKTVTLPADSNTDTQVTQAYSTANNSYPVLFSATADVSSTSSRGATTAILNNVIYANPSTGNLHVTQLNGVTVGTSPKFTDVNVTQTEIGSINANYELLFSGTADGTTRTEGTNKSGYLTYNPYTHQLSNTGRITSRGISSTISNNDGDYQTTISQSYSAINFTISGEGTSSTYQSSIGVGLAASLQTTYYDEDEDETYTSAIRIYQNLIRLFGPDDYDFIYINTNTKSVSIHDVVTPTSNYDAANKKYVDDTVATKIGGSGTSGYLAKFNDTRSLTNGPAIGTGTTKFLREDGSWQVPSYTTNTDTKLQVAEVTSATQYYPLVGTGTTAATRQYDTTGFKYKGTNGTTSVIGSATLELGNSTASGTANNKQGQLIMYGSNAKKVTITLAAPSADIALALPTSGGTLALTSQIPTVPTKASSATTGITATTTATKTTLGTAVTASKASGGNGTAPSWTFSGVTVANSISGTIDANDSTQLNITLGTTTVQSKSGGSNGSASTWSFTDVSVPVVSTAAATVSITDPGHTHTLS